ncbi:diaminobutyrate--2-oxoglutarate transaminase [Bordetella genomosp. 8]|uniref:Diaminobutyrate--2-oxoglutarate transaminase n=1 Tax=Bordetella genomosp. 8 TaxID=1416806 RepID=A0A1W6YJT2_9BORD|nr:diaminobutyrate--2-oxoglutarate transaminase family protein [Bordetella genomosp. 8]ARP81327.1 diaminobutyrate--2-oxoglutarate transaminase [Bordetella genomosp. 8]
MAYSHTAVATETELARRHDPLARPYQLGDNALLRYQAGHESNARSYPRRLPLALRRAKGIYVEDVEGRVFIDCLAGAGALALGHNHPAVLEAIGQALRDDAPMLTLDLTTPVKDRFMRDLFDTLPPAFARDARVQFCGPAGTDAVEAALKLVKSATGRADVLAFQGAYHGMTQGALQLMGNLQPKRSLNTPLAGVQFLPYPYDYRCPFGLRGEAGVRAGLNYIGSVLNDPEGGVPRPAGMILEAVQGEGGVIPAPASWLQGVRALTAAADVPLIADEIQSGFGRTGKTFAFEHADIVPDAIVLSKAIGGGLPLAVVVYRKELDLWSGGTHAGTFRGNQLAMAAGSATMRVLRAEPLAEHAGAMGLRLLGLLRQLQRDVPQIGDVRGCGLMVGVELVRPDADARGPRADVAVGPVDTVDAADAAASGLGATLRAAPPAHPTLAGAVQAECLRRGLIVELGGRHGSVVRFLPPLIISEAQIDRVFDIFSLSVRAALSAPANVMGTPAPAQIAAGPPALAPAV